MGQGKGPLPSSRPRRTRVHMPQTSDNAFQEGVFSKQCPRNNNSNFKFSTKKHPNLAWFSWSGTPAFQPFSLRLDHIRGQCATLASSQVGQCPGGGSLGTEVCTESSGLGAGKTCSCQGPAHLLGGSVLWGLEPQGLRCMAGWT